jgi:hypothetical protein
LRAIEIAAPDARNWLGLDVSACLVGWSSLDQMAAAPTKRNLNCPSHHVYRKM